MRFNMPFGRVGAREFGTYYIAYARTSELIEQMLSNMFIGDPPGNTDRILDFSTAITGGLFFAPAADLLEGLAPDDAARGIGDARAPTSAVGRAGRRITRDRRLARRCSLRRAAHETIVRCRGRALSSHPPAHVSNSLVISARPGRRSVSRPPPIRRLAR